MDNCRYFSIYFNVLYLYGIIIYYSSQNSYPTITPIINEKIIPITNKSMPKRLKRRKRKVKSIAERSPKQNGIILKLPQNLYSTNQNSRHNTHQNKSKNSHFLPQSNIHILQNNVKIYNISFFQNNKEKNQIF